MMLGVRSAVAGLVLLPGSLLALERHSRFELPDRLPRVGSADFVLAAMRAQLEPAYRKRGLGLDFRRRELKQSLLLLDDDPELGPWGRPFATVHHKQPGGGALLHQGSTTH